MLTTITAVKKKIFLQLNHGKYFQHIFLQKRAHKCKKNTKIPKGNITSKNETSKKPSKFKDYFPEILYCPLWR
jgi:hypothetical protein